MRRSGPHTMSTATASESTFFANPPAPVHIPTAWAIFFVDPQRSTNGTFCSQLSNPAISYQVGNRVQSSDEQLDSGALAGRQPFRKLTRRPPAAKSFSGMPTHRPQPFAAHTVEPRMPIRLSEGLLGFDLSLRDRTSRSRTHRPMRRPRRATTAAKHKRGIPNMWV